MKIEDPGSEPPSGKTHNRGQSGRRMRLTWVPLATALLPAVGVHLSYLIAADQGHVPWCLVHLQGCSSISATGRMTPERIVFLATVAPTAFLLALYWALNLHWLKHLGGRDRWAGRLMLALGLSAALGLLAYLFALGQPGDWLKVQRRMAVALFYVALTAAQLLLTWQLARLPVLPARRIGRGTQRLLVALCAAVLAGALASLLLIAVWDNYRDLEDAFEWSLTVLIFTHVLVTGSAWRQSGFEARLFGLQRTA